MEVADRIIVMRDGEVVGDVPRAGTDEKKLSTMMIGRELPPLPEEPAVPSRAREMLRLESIAVRDRHGVVRLKNLSFSIREGEILGIAGVSGNGQQELCEALCGSLSLASGRMVLNGRDLGSLGIRRTDRARHRLCSRRPAEGRRGNGDDRG